MKQVRVGLSFTKLVIALIAILLGLILPGSHKAVALDLDPEKIRVQPPKSDIAVVQNRYFEKSFRPEIGLMAGSIMNEAYTDTSYVGYRVGMFFAENFGLELGAQLAW